MADGVSGVRAPETLRLDDPEQANAILRAVQEIVTNAKKHAGAQNVWIELAANRAGVNLSARDDGGGAADVTPGHGLTGMRERFEQLRGQVEFRTAPGQGFEVRASLPAGSPQA